MLCRRTTRIAVSSRSAVCSAAQPQVATPDVVTKALAVAGSSVKSAAAQLWHLDINRLQADRDYTLDLQDRSRGALHDAAKVPLFSYVSPSVWEKPTYGTFWRLLDNYVAETGVAEQVTKLERAEEIGFLRA
eukprot:IDg18952t1